MSLFFKYFLVFKSLILLVVYISIDNQRISFNLFYACKQYKQYKQIVP